MILKRLYFSKTLSTVTSLLLISLILSVGCFLNERRLGELHNWFKLFKWAQLRVSLKLRFLCTSWSSYAGYLG